MKALNLLILFLLILSQSDAKFVNGTEGTINLKIYPENQTKFIDEFAEYKINIEIEDTGVDTKCNLDGQNFIVRTGFGKYKKEIEKKIYPQGAGIINFSHNLYCEANFDYDVYVWNITKFGIVYFIPYPINFSVKFSNETIKIDCENPEKNVKIIVENIGKGSVACHYEKIFGNTLESGAIPSPIKHGEKSEFYLNFSINEIPENIIETIKNFSAKVKIYCYDAYNNALVKEENLTIIANLSVREKILICERKILNLQNGDIAEIEDYLNKAKRYENLKACGTSDIYAEKCLSLIEEKEKLIEKIKQKEELIKEKKENALNKINELREKISKINYTKSEKAIVFINNANSMLSIAQNKFLEGDYDYAITASEQGIENVNYAIKIIEEEKEEEKKKIEESKETEKEENLTKNETLKNEKEKVKEEKPIDTNLIIIIIIIILLAIVVVLILLIIKYSRGKKEKVKK